MSSLGSAAKVSTRRFRAPELWLGKAKSTSSDMFAFGVLLWEFYACAVPFADIDDDIIGNLILRGERLPTPNLADATSQGFPADYFALMEECWLDDPKKRPTAEQVHRRLLTLDPSARAVQGPILLWHPARTRAPASLLQCILLAMQARPGQSNSNLAPMLQAMVAEAAHIISGSPNVQQLMQEHLLTDMEAQALSVYTTDARDHGGSREQSIFYLYNAAIRSAVAHDIELWSTFSFLFCNALQKLPSVIRTVFRGLDVPMTQLSHQYFAGGNVWLTSITSTTSDKTKTLLQFGTGASGRPGTLLQINAVDAKDISDFSKYKTENEFVVPPNSCHKVRVALSSVQVVAACCAVAFGQDGVIACANELFSGGSSETFWSSAQRCRLDRDGSAEVCRGFQQ
jgi:serine/threonine protein kinase